ncbi:hypothetical protein ACSXEK_15960 (plasmid) [Clostridium perfringens]
MIFNERKYKELANKICTGFSKLCSSNSCGECKYAFQSNCKILFTLDYLENKNISNLELTQAVSGVKKKILECDELYFDNI